MGWKWVEGRLLLYILINSIGAVQIRYHTWRGGVYKK